MSAALGVAWAAGEASKVMGSIDIAPGERAGDVSTVNGSIHIGDNAVVERAHTVNGSISVEPRASAAELKTVDGSIHLQESVRGERQPNARVDGGIHVQKDSGWSDSGSQTPPRVVVGPGSVVGGTLNFERPVNLYVSDRATCE